MNRQDYRRMNLIQKQRFVLAKMRRLQLARCPTCNTCVLARELPAHVAERCPGEPPTPHVLQVLSTLGPVAGDGTRGLPAGDHSKNRLPCRATDTSKPNPNH